MAFNYQEKTISILKKHGLKPKKNLGQNFLIDNNAILSVLKAGELKKNDTILEIGPGLGFLTETLANETKQVIAVEKDHEFTKILKKQFKKHENIKIVQGDILKTQISKNEKENFSIGLKNYKIIANLPYYITSPVIRKFLEEKNPPKLMVLMVQKEVAQRICAKPPKMSLLSIAVQLKSLPKIIKIVKKESFSPVPKVDSAIIKIIPIQGVKKDFDQEHFFKIVRAGFSSPRKQIKNNLKKVFGDKIEKILLKLDIDSKRRAETLTIGEWKAIMLELKSENKTQKDN